MYLPIGERVGIMKLACISPSIELFSETNGRVSVFTKGSGKLYALGKREYEILISLDGTKTAGELSRTHGISEPLQVEKLIDQFKKLGFLKGTEQKRRQSLWKLRKGLVNGNKLVNPEKLVWKILYNILVWGTIPVFLIGCYLILPHLQIVMGTIVEGAFSPNILLLLPMVLAMLSVHELGHVLVARMQNVNVPEVGIMLYWFMPCAYTNLSGITFLKSKGKRMLCLFAGILTNIFIAGVCLIIVALSASPATEFLAWLALANISLVFVNLQLFIKLDGYFIMQEFLGMNRLRETAFSELLLLLRGSRRISGERQKYSVRSYDIEGGAELRKTVLYLYSVASALYIPILLMSLLASIYSFILR